MKKLVSNSHLSNAWHQVAFRWLKSRPLKKALLKNIETLNLEKLKESWSQLRPTPKTPSQGMNG